MIEPFLALPECYYPQFAPLPVPMAKHLIREEYRWSRKKAETRRQTPEQIWATIEKRVRDARAIVYEYMNPFVITGQPNPFPSTAWLLDTLADYTPKGKRNALQTVYYWQDKGLLRRDRPRGHLDPTNVAAFLVARIAEKEHQRNWLPAKLEKNEPYWWCITIVMKRLLSEAGYVIVPPGLKPNGLHLGASRCNRLLDWFSPSNVSGGVDVSVHRHATLSTEEGGLTLAVRFLAMPTRATRPAGIAGINHTQRYTCKSRLVGKELTMVPDRQFYCSQHHGDTYHKEL